MARPRKLPAGMQLRGSTYYANFCKDGRRVRRRLSRDFATAKAALNKLRAQADQPDFDLRDNDLPLKELHDRYVRHCEQCLRPKTVTRYRQNLKAILDVLAVTNVCHVTTDAITTYRKDRLDQAKSIRTVNMEVGALSTMFNWAVDHKLIGSNPLAKVRPLANDEKKKVRRALTVEEVQAIFAKSPDYLKPVWRMFATTGIRHDELVNMRFKDVDHERRCVTVYAKNNKSHKTREIPLDDAMLATIAELESQAKERQLCTSTTADLTRRVQESFSRDHVFVGTANTPLRRNLLRRFYSVCKAAGIEDAHPGGSVDIHGMRVTFTTLSLDNGANPKAIQDILGHSTLKMTMGVYAKATERGKRAAIAALPFAVVTAPEHVIALDTACGLQPNSSGAKQVVAG